MIVRNPTEEEVSVITSELERLNNDSLRVNDSRSYAIYQPPLFMIVTWFCESDKSISYAITDGNTGHFVCADFLNK